MVIKKNAWSIEKFNLPTFRSDFGSYKLVVKAIRGNQSGFHLLNAKYVCIYIYVVYLNDFIVILRRYDIVKNK